MSIVSFVIQAFECRLISAKYEKMFFGVSVDAAAEIVNHGGFAASKDHSEYGTQYTASIKIAPDALCEATKCLKRSELSVGQLYDIVILGKPYTFQGTSGYTLEGYVREIPPQVNSESSTELDVRVLSLLENDRKRTSESETEVTPPLKRQRLTTPTTIPAAPAQNPVLIRQKKGSVVPI